MAPPPTRYASDSAVAAPDRPPVEDVEPPGRSRRRPWPRLVAAAAALPLVLGAVLLATAQPLTGGGWQSGVYRDACQREPAVQFGTWRGRPVDRVGIYLPTKSWSAISDPTWALNCWRGTSMPLTISVPLLPDTGATLREGATGAYDEHFRTLAANLVGADLADVTIRLGWEMNGDWMPWSAIKDPAAFRRYWQRVVTTMRAVPGAAFTFDWSVSANADFDFPAQRAYPGDAYVDYIGASVYDKLPADPAASPQQRWQQIVDGRNGLAWQAAFAAQHDKPLAFGEWGLVGVEPGQGGGGDDPYFIRRFHDWVATHRVGYEIYFETNHDSDNRHALMRGNTTGPQFPRGAAAYQQDFGR